MVKLSASALGVISERVDTPAYDRSAVKTGIVHFGVGSFHRSHEAMYVDRLLRAGGNDTWGICGVGVLASDSRMRQVMRDQDDLYTLVVKHPDGESQARVIGSITEYLFAPDDPGAVVEKLASASTRIVSLTVTEGGYSVNDATGEFDATGADTIADLQPNAVLRTVFGLMTEALRLRRDRGIAPFTVMSCDNIQGNGHVAGIALTSFARIKNPELGEWIAENVSFPNSMVDRITPATTPASIAAVADTYGVDDKWPVVSEAFAQWVLEDAFTIGRPDFASVGVHMVGDVKPYEFMKLRLLNASHQAMSYLGLLAGFTYVHEVVVDAIFVDFLLDYMVNEASPTLRPIPGVDLDAYRHELISRFSNIAIADTLERQAVDGSQRIPKFLLPVVRDQLSTGGQIDHAALVLAAWSVFLEGVDESGQPLAISDVRSQRLRDAVGREVDDPGALLDLTDVFGELGQNQRLRDAYIAARIAIKTNGAMGALEGLNRKRTS